LYAGGLFGNAGNVSAWHVARWSGTSWSALGSGTNAPVNALAIHDDDLYVGGQFSLAGNKTSLQFAIWHDIITSALVSEFGASPLSEGIEVRWRLDERDGPMEVRLERAASRHGPWTAAAAELRTDGAATVALDRDVVIGRTYFYRLVVVGTRGSVVTFGPLEATAGSAIQELAVTSVSPNPSFGAVRIEYALGRAAPVELCVVDVKGRVVTVLMAGRAVPGRHQALWNGETSRGRAPAGIYFVRLRQAGASVARRIVLLR
jgi:hypothetical protein